MHLQAGLVQGRYSAGSRVCKRTRPVRPSHRETRPLHEPHSDGYRAKNYHRRRHSERDKRSVGAARASHTDGHEVFVFGRGDARAVLYLQHQQLEHAHDFRSQRSIRDSAYAIGEVRIVFNGVFQ